MSNKINVRSPYYVTMTDSPSTLELRIWTGAESAVPTEATYTLTKDAVGGYATFEVAELIRDYIDNTFDGNYDSSLVWVRANATTPVIAFDGYTSYADGVNAQGNLKQLISNTTIWCPDGADILVPVFAQGASYNVVFKDASDATINTVAVTDQTDTANIIQYAASTIGANNVATVEIGATTLQVRQMDCSKYDTYKLTFVNKFGALQDLYFLGKSTESISVQKDNYKSNVLDIASQSYSSTDHQYRDFDVKGRQSTTINTGYVSEDYNEPIKQLLLSEKVWMTIGSDVIPVNVKTNSLVMQTSLNDKLVNYTIDVDFAHDTIQNVR